jgi:hypothetical protein
MVVLIRAGDLRNLLRNQDTLGKFYKNALDSIELAPHLQAIMEGTVAVTVTVTCSHPGCRTNTRQVNHEFCHECRKRLADRAGLLGGRKIP